MKSNLLLTGEGERNGRGLPGIEERGREEGGKVMETEYGREREKWRDEERRREGEKVG